MTFKASDRKYSYFLLATIGCIIILSIPMMYGHFFHEGHLFYIAIHETGFLLASFLTTITLISYKKTKLKRMLFSSSAFGVLAFGQGEIMYQQMNDLHDYDIMSSGEILEYCVVIMMILFALGIFYKQ
jgi:hypothetical protein|tara:strand:- start:113 stop:496 length:384 start_codon:yes stop_codon:yes gene_type:complete